MGSKNYVLSSTVKPVEEKLLHRVCFIFWNASHYLTSPLLDPMSLVFKDERILPVKIADCPWFTSKLVPSVYQKTGPSGARRYYVKWPSQI